MSTLNADLATFIQKHLVGDDRGIAIADDTPLIEKGIVDSIGLMQIVAYLEERVGVRVSDDDVIPDNFETVTAIVQLVTRLQGRRAGA